MNTENEFNEEKVKKIIEEDAFLYREYESKASSHPEKKALEIIFQAYILTDSVLENKYQNIKI